MAKGKNQMIPKRYEFIVFGFLTSLFMSFLISGVISYVNVGLVENFIILWLEAFYKAFFVAFPSILLVVPQVRKIVQKIVNTK